MTMLAWDRLDQAADVIDTGLAASSGGSETSCRLAMGITAVGIAAARGAAAAARSAAIQLGAELEQVSDRPDLLARWCAVAQAQARLPASPTLRSAALRPRPKTTPATPPGWNESRWQRPISRSAGRSWWRSCSRRCWNRASRSWPWPSRLRFCSRWAADRQHRDSAALAAITAAIDLAQHEGLVRPILDAGPTAAALIRRHRNVTSHHLEFTEHLLPVATKAIGKPSVLLVSEQLTERELIVLRYLPTMLKAAEIAADLFVSVNTVKSHHRSIYRKFAVTSRRAAVDRARDLNLL